MKTPHRANQRRQGGGAVIAASIRRANVDQLAAPGWIAVLLFGLVGWASVPASAAPGRVTPVGAGVRRVSFPPPAEMTRADVYLWETPSTVPRAVLVICPGLNGNGEGLVRQAIWQEFARANRLALCGVSFVSADAEMEALRGYIHAERGSGDLLLQAVRLGFGRDLPIMIYGFSCGGRLAISVADWQPARVLCWCGYSASWWEPPQLISKNFPPGIVACGEEDALNYATSTTFFAVGRAAGLPWTWVSLGHTGHAWTRPLDDFVRAYFAAVLRAGDGPVGTNTSGRAGAGCWRDVDTKAELSTEQVRQQPTLASWLPDPSLENLWRDLHCP